MVSAPFLSSLCLLPPPLPSLLYFPLVSAFLPFVSCFLSSSPGIVSSRIISFLPTIRSVFFLPLLSPPPLSRFNISFYLSPFLHLVFFPTLNFFSLFFFPSLPLFRLLPLASSLPYSSSQLVSFTLFLPRFFSSLLLSTGSFFLLPFALFFPLPSSPRFLSSLS